MIKRSLIHSAVLAAAAVFLFVGVASAQQVRTRDDSRDEEQLKVEVRQAMERDTDVANTALVFNNVGPTETGLVCTGYNANGIVLSRKFARIPGNGVRYLRASDLSNGADFIGSAVCTVRGRVAASAIFLAPGAMTNLDVIQAGPWDSTKIRFPLIATY